MCLLRCTSCLWIIVVLPMSTPRTFVWSDVTQLCRGTLLPGRTRLPVPRRTVYQSASLDWLMETPTVRQGSLLPSHCAGSYVFFLTELQNPLNPWAKGQPFLLVFQSSCFASLPEHRLSWHNLCGLPESVQELPGRYLRFGHNRFLPHCFQFIVHWRHTVVTQPNRARRVIVRSGQSVLLRWINGKEGKISCYLQGMLQVTRPVLGAMSSINFPYIFKLS